MKVSTIILIAGVAYVYANRNSVKDIFTKGEDMQLTPNFKFSEFAGSTKLEPNQVTAETMRQVKIMADTLEIVRSEIGNKPITFNSGIRTLAKNQSIGGSLTSDHFYNENPNYQLSVGAVDIVCPSMNTVDFYNAILDLKYKGKIKTGQLLLEKNVSFWVHLANDPRAVLPANLLSKRSDSSINLVAYSLDNGKTFTKIPNGQFVRGIQ